MNKSDSELQVDIIRKSLNNLNFNLSLCETSEDNFWVGAQEEFKMKILKEEKLLDKYKITHPELFI